jgi:hypothetical protein
MGRKCMQMLFQQIMGTEVKKTLVIFPVLFGFFVMGFVDVVGIATNYIKEDFALY